MPKRLEGYVDAVHVSDNFLAQPHMSGTVAACMIEQQTNLETILHMTCRDRNRMQLQADLLGAHAMGVRNVLCLTGDHPSLGDHKEAKGRFRPGFAQLSFAWCARCATRAPLTAGVKSLCRQNCSLAVRWPLLRHRLNSGRTAWRRRWPAGVDFITSQLVFDMSLLESFMRRGLTWGLFKTPIC